MSITYKIGEAATLLNLKSHVLRFWETEFADIAPLRTEKGQRLYTTEHLALLQRIRYLLHDRGLTIGGARKTLAEEKQRGTVYTYCQPGAATAAPLHLTSDSSLSEHYRATEGGGLPTSAKTAETGPDTAEPALLAQYNLPGLERLVSLRASILDSEAGEAYSPVKEDAPRSPIGTGGMLPLFTDSFAAYSSGPGGVTEGGGNFIHAGETAPEFCPAPKAEAEGCAERDEFLRAVCRDLESIAALLR